VDEPQVIADTWSAGTGTGLAQGDTVILRCHGLPLLTIYTVILLSLLSISVKVTVLPWATLHRSSPAPSRRSRRQVRDSGARAGVDVTAVLASPTTTKFSSKIQKKLRMNHIRVLKLRSGEVLHISIVVAHRNHPRRCEG
jgi:hypothetical protein